MLSKAGKTLKIRKNMRRAALNRHLMSAKITLKKNGSTNTLDLSGYLAERSICKKRRCFQRDAEDSNGLNRRAGKGSFGVPVSFKPRGRLEPELSRPRLR